MTKKWITLLGLPLILMLTGSNQLPAAQSIAEKKANLKTAESDLGDHEQNLFQINQETEELYEKIQALYEEAFRLYQTQAPEGQYRQLLNQINAHRRRLAHLESTWRLLSSKSNRVEGYGLWHAPETTLEQLIIDYGSQDYVYLIPPEIGSMKLSINSNIPIPRSQWNEMLELILAQNGVGIQTLNPYLRQLYLVQKNHSNLSMITNRRCDLEVLPPHARVSFVLSPEPSEIRRTYAFLEKFVNPNTMTLQILGREIILVGQAAELQDLLKLYDFIATNRGEKEYRIIPLYKIRAEEMARILASMFDQGDA